VGRTISQLIRNCGRWINIKYSMFNRALWPENAQSSSCYLTDSLWPCSGCQSGFSFCVSVCVCVCVCLSAQVTHLIAVYYAINACKCLFKCHPRHRLLIYLSVCVCVCICMLQHPHPATCNCRYLSLQVALSQQTSIYYYHHDYHHH